MTRLRARPVGIPAWVGGLRPEAEPGASAPGTLESGTDFRALPAGRLQVRGGSRVLFTLVNTNLNEIDHVCFYGGFSPCGALVIGWDDELDKHYAWRISETLAFFTGSQATSRHDLTAAPSTSWNNAGSPAGPLFAELFEKAFLVDATTEYANRNELLSIDATGAIVRPTFAFDGGSAVALKPYCVEEYNNHLFIAGHGDETVGDRPELVRHSFLGRSPDSTTGGAEGFDKDAWNMIGAKGQRVTAMRKGRGMLLVAKQNELHRITGFGAALAGWQFITEQVENTDGNGATNPLALTYMEPYFYGIGQAGIWRCDGYRLDYLGGSRLRDFAGTNQPLFAWAAPHPSRRMVVFGLHPSQASTGRSVTYPWRVWVWDVEREVWQPDWLFGTDLFHANVHPIAQTIGPSAPPNTPSTTNIQTKAFTANWVNGDTTASTELWVKPDGGSYALYSVHTPGDTDGGVGGLDEYSLYYWKVRHKKGGQYSEFTAEQTVGTLIPAPIMVGAGPQKPYPGARVTVTQVADGTDLNFQREDYLVGNWVTIEQVSAVPAGNYTWDDPDLLNCTPTVRYRAFSSDASWPSPNGANSSASAEVNPCP